MAKSIYGSQRDSVLNCTDTAKASRAIYGLDGDETIAAQVGNAELLAQDTSVIPSIALIAQQAAAENLASTTQVDMNAELTLVDTSGEFAELVTLKNSDPVALDVASITIDLY